MQKKEELEKFYEAEDPWKFKTTPDDIKRRDKIVFTAQRFAPRIRVNKRVEASGKYDRALDIGAGEGFVTSHLPANKIYGYELSDLAASRFPSNVKRCYFPEGKYDLVVATGVFYPQYNWEEMVNIIVKHTGGIFITCNIKEMEDPGLNSVFLGNQIYQEEFQYRQIYTQRLRVYGLGI